ncbi:acyl carrier protein [Thalassospira australica]|uniref:acyl carrier protein n=1 Tax=Thalassospira australica TaxID=1528106 RepID=UPI00051A607E|nr:acyl carrier protein [Thalassospira australica]
MTETKVHIKSLMAEIFECDVDDIDDDAAINETIGWDSLNHINLIVALTSQGIDVSPLQIPELTTYAKIASFVECAD